MKMTILQLGGAYVLALNEAYLEAEEEVNLSPGDELAVIPPIRFVILMVQLQTFFPVQFQSLYFVLHFFYLVNTW